MRVARTSMLYRSRECLGTAGLLSCVALLPWIVACSGVLAPEDGVEVTVAATPQAVVLGDTVHLLGVAFNPTGTTIRPESGCAPGIGFYVRHGAGSEVSLYDGLAFTCPRRDSQDIEPGETDSINFEWTPSSAGTYHVRAALVFGGPRSPSDAIVVTVR